MVWCYLLLSRAYEALTVNYINNIIISSGDLKISGPQTDLNNKIFEQLASDDDESTDPLFAGAIGKEESQVDENFPKAIIDVNTDNERSAPGDEQDMKGKDNSTVVSSEPTDATLLPTVEETSDDSPTAKRRRILFVK